MVEIDSSAGALLFKNYIYDTPLPHLFNRFQIDGSLFL